MWRPASSHTHTHTHTRAHTNTPHKDPYVERVLREDEYSKAMQEGGHVLQEVLQRADGLQVARRGRNRKCVQHAQGCMALQGATLHQRENRWQCEVTEQFHRQTWVLGRDTPAVSATTYDTHTHTHTHTYTPTHARMHKQFTHTHTHPHTKGLALRSITERHFKVLTSGRWGHTTTQHVHCTYPHTRLVGTSAAQETVATWTAHGLQRG